jgi:hypothetical protein
MANKKKSEGFEELDEFMQLLATPGGIHNIMGKIFSGMQREEKEKYPHERLGAGFELRKIEMKDKKGEVIDNRNSYSHLYHNDLKVSSEVFRKGGTCSGFKDGYCALIHYVPSKDPKKSTDGFDFGTHVLINEVGDIALKGGTWSSDHPYHIGGHLASIGNYIYDLRTAKAIAPKSSTTIKGVNCIIIEHRYDWYNKEVTLPLGIYRIDFETAELTKLDNVK